MKKFILLALLTSSLQPISAHAESTEHSIETSYTLQTDTGEHSEFKSNQPFSINAKYMNADQPVTGAKIIARFPSVPYAKPIELFDDGAHNDGNANDGLYSNLYPGFKEAVFAQIFVKAEYKDVTTESFNRTVTVRPDYAALGNNFSDSAVNIDTHPSLDVIRVNAEVIVSKDAEILVTSALCDHRGAILATSGWDTKVDEPLKPGTHKIFFNFDTARLYNTGLPGPYKLCNVTITEINSGMPIQHVSGAVYDTKVYDINLFNR